MTDKYHVILQHVAGVRGDVHYGVSQTDPT
jgi:hypothetical protein